MVRFPWKVKKLAHVLNHPQTHWYDSFFLLINTIVIALSLFFSSDHPIYKILYFFVYVFIIFFLGETLIRLFVLKKRFFHDFFNVISLTVLMGAIILSEPTLTLILSFRAFRAFRSIKKIPKTQHVINMFFHSIPGFINLLVLIIFSYSIFGLLGTSLFGEKVPHLWGSFSASIITLEQIMVGDDWGHNVRATEQFYPYANIFFLSFLFLVGYILLNLFVGIIVDAMQSSKPFEEKEEATDKTTKELINLLKKADKDIAELTKMLSQSQNNKKAP